MRTSLKRINYRNGKYRVVINGEGKTFKYLYDAIKYRDGKETVEKDCEIKVGEKIIVEHLNRYIQYRDYRSKYRIIKDSVCYGSFATLKEARKERNRLFGRQKVELGENWEKPFRIRAFRKRSQNYTYYNKLIYAQYGGW